MARKYPKAANQPGMYNYGDFMKHKVDSVKKAGYEKLSKPTSGAKWNSGTWVKRGKNG